MKGKERKKKRKRKARKGKERKTGKGWFIQCDEYISLQNDKRAYLADMFNCTRESPDLPDMHV